MKDTIIYIVTKVLSIITLMMLYPVAKGLVSPAILSLSVVFLAVMLIVYTRKFKPLALFFIFTLPYIFITLPHFLGANFPLSLGYTQFDKEGYYIHVEVIHSLFIATIALFLPYLKRQLIIKDILPIKDSPILFWSIVLGMLFIILFGKTGNNIFESGGYGSANAHVQSLGGLSIYEYFLVLSPVAYIFSGLKRSRLGVILVLMLIFSVKGLLFGGRIEALQAFLQIFILFFDKEKLKLRIVIIAAAIPAFMFMVFGFVRSSPDVGFSKMVQLVMQNLSTTSYLLLANHIDIYYSSARLYGFIQENIITFGERLYSLVLNIAAIVVPYDKLPAIANLAAFKQSSYPAGGGGLISAYFYVFLSYPGVIFIGLMFSLLIRKIIYHTTTYLLLYSIMVFTTYPRWFGYNPNALFKMSFYILPLYFLIRMLPRANPNQAITELRPGNV